ncbi:3-keto-5-aminohexanoate cleavage protein [Microbacterium sp. A93]|uniref:3-keto-5-aminohexanoate cleavage protein n=1 Tax=Microbacterium sp. A93 TaxID=3450716 RepID=UPI003F42AAA0
MTMLLTLAPTGAETQKSVATGLPTTVDELVQVACRAELSGVGMIHVHVRDTLGRSTMKLEALTEAVEALRASTNLIIQLSTGGSTADAFEDRLAALDALPDSCSLSMGSVNFGKEIFRNPWELIVALHEGARDRQIVPEYELFDLGQVAALHKLLERHGLPYGGKVHCDFVLGVPGGMPADTMTLAYAVSRLPAAVSSWSATGVGLRSVPIMLAATSLGGHLRIGMEDTLSLARDVPVEDNQQLIDRALGVIGAAGQTPMTVSDARAMLGIRP